MRREVEGMKKKELMTLNPPEFTPYLKQIAKQDQPVPSDHWGTNKKYKYGRYLRVKEEKQQVRASRHLPPMT